MTISSELQRLYLDDNHGVKIPVYNKQLIAYVNRHCFDPSPVLAAIRAEASKDEMGYMITGADQAAFLHFLAKMTSAKRILEIGCYLGHSAIALASALPSDGRLLALDHNPIWSAKARGFFEQAGLSDRIDLRLGEALELLDDVSREEAAPFDMVFIDADKKNAHNYFMRTLPLLRSGGLLIVDNVLWRGGIVDMTDQSERAVALRQLNEAVMQLSNLEPMILTLSDGMLVVRKN